MHCSELAETHAVASPALGPARDRPLDDDSLKLLPSKVTLAAPDEAVLTATAELGTSASAVTAMVSDPEATASETTHD